MSNRIVWVDIPVLDLERADLPLDVAQVCGSGPSCPGCCV